MKRKGNIVALLVAESRVHLARTPEAREEAAADVVVTKFVAGYRITDADKESIETLLQTAERHLRSARRA